MATPTLSISSVQLVFFTPFTLGESEGAVLVHFSHIRGLEPEEQVRNVRYGLWIELEAGLYVVPPPFSSASNCNSKGNPWVAAPDRIHNS